MLYFLPLTFRIMNSFFSIDRDSFDLDIKNIKDPEIRNRVISVLDEVEDIAGSHGLYSHFNISRYLFIMQEKICVSEIVDDHDFDKVAFIVFSVAKQIQQFFVENSFCKSSRVLIAQEYTSNIGFYLLKRYVFKDIDYQDGGPIIPKGIHVICYNKNGRLRESFVFDLDDNKLAEEKFLEIREKLKKYDELEKPILSLTRK